jgi:hypothetical protein
MQGKLAQYTFTLDSGDEKLCTFCPDCGSRIYHTGTNESDILSIKGGSLDAIYRINPIGHIWTDSALEWIKQGNLRGFIYTQQPDSFDDMIAKFVSPVID